jgi:hypothetical protein
VSGDRKGDRTRSNRTRGWSRENERVYNRFFTGCSLDPATQSELDAAWNAAMSQAPTVFDLRCAIALAEMKPQLSDVPTWEQLAPFYV